VINLSTTFRLPLSTIQAVRSVSFSLDKGEALGVVGESGSGKTVLMHSLLRLPAQPPAELRGQALYNGIDLLTCSDAQIRSIRGNRIAVIFQDPSAAFNPYLRLVDQLVEPVMLHTTATRREAEEKAVQALNETGIPDAAKRIRAYPHQFSGGMLQRAMIAMALVMEPDIIIADEPTTALDVTVQAQILTIMKRLIADKQISVIFITHNLGIVGEFCNRINVMYAGRILETAPATALVASAAHPYTRALIGSVPGITDRPHRLTTIPGVPPDLSDPPAGCPFHPRCLFATDKCMRDLPELTEIAPGRFTACIRMAAGEIT